MGSPLADAARALARGELVVYPTDTLLGMAALGSDAAAVARLEEVKGRPGGPPISLALSSVDELETWAELAPASRAWVRRHLPGPYTLLVVPTTRARRTFPPSVLPPRGRLGLRVPDHPIARELARRVGPITATSANLHGYSPCRTARAARRTFGESVAVYVPGGPSPSGRPSLLVDVTQDRPRLVPRR
ncbi:MAG: threonylcarbamoyl-AMP synthase [Thermoplasmata archaeon]|nr:threonylcarbamoyl-AMP synthase [Thermoplasmata archaeon]